MTRYLTGEEVILGDLVSLEVELGCWDNSPEEVVVGIDKGNLQVKILSCLHRPDEDRRFCVPFSGLLYKMGVSVGSVRFMSRAGEADC